MLIFLGIIIVVLTVVSVVGHIYSGIIEKDYYARKLKRKDEELFIESEKAFKPSKIYLDHYLAFEKTLLNNKTAVINNRYECSLKGKSDFIVIDTVTGETALFDLNATNYSRVVEYGI